MPILDFQRQLTEIGRIRVGKSVDNGHGKKRAVGLNCFLVTTRSRQVADWVAENFGGKVERWEVDEGQWAVSTTTDELVVVAPPAHGVISMDYEMRDQRGALVRRCDGATNRVDGTSCACPPDIDTRMRLAKDARACKPVAMVKVMLADSPVFGVFRLVTAGWYVVPQLAGTAEFMQNYRDLTAAASGTPQFLRAALRVIRVGGPTSKSRSFSLEILETPRDLLTGALPERPIAQQLPPPPQRALAAGPATAVPVPPPVAASPQPAAAPAPTPETPPQPAGPADADHPPVVDPGDLAQEIAETAQRADTPTRLAMQMQRATAAGVLGQEVTIGDEVLELADYLTDRTRVVVTAHRTAAAGAVPPDEHPEVAAEPLGDRPSWDEPDLPEEEQAQRMARCATAATTWQQVKIIGQAAATRGLREHLVSVDGRNYPLREYLKLRWHALAPDAPTSAGAGSR